MKYLYIKAEYNIKIIYASELVRLIYKSIISNMQLPFLIRQFSIFLVNNRFAGAFNSHRLRGFHNGRGRFVFKCHKLSRMQLKVLANKAQIVGVQRAR